MSMKFYTSKKFLPKLAGWIFSLSLFGRMLPLFCGDYTASFLEIGVGARALGMGGAFCSMANDGTSFYWNPAGLSFVRRPQLCGMYGPQFGSFRNPLGNFHFLGYTHPLPGNSVLAVNWIRLRVDDIPIFSELEGDLFWERLHDPLLRPSGEPEGYFNDTEDAFFFSFAKMNRWKLDLGWGYHDVRVEIPFGVNFKWIRQSLGDHEASGLGLDVGAMIRFHLDDFFETEKLGVLSWGINLQDVTGTRLSWTTKHQDVVPMNTKWGLSYLHPLPVKEGSLCLSFDKDSRWGGKKRWGLEFSGFRVLRLRSGLDDGNFTCGVGIRFWVIGVDYAFLSHELDSLHRISCSVSF